MPQEKINPWVIALRILFTLALIWAVVFIFSNSMEVAQVSSAHSDEVLALVNPILAKVNLGPLTSHQIRKLAHFAEYTLLGFLAMLCLRVYTRSFVRHISWPLLLGLLAANADETLQWLLASDRDGSLRDVWLDFLGCSCGVLCAICLLLIVSLVAMALRPKKR